MLSGYRQISPVFNSFLLLAVAVSLSLAAATEQVQADVANRSRSGKTDWSSLTQWLDEQYSKQHTASDDLKDAGLVDDLTFLRRVYLDLSGRIPSVAELRDFRRNRSATKRIDVIEKLLASDRYGKHLARVWRRILIPTNVQVSNGTTTPFEDWLGNAFNSNAPYDEQTRQLIVAGGAERKDSTEKPDKAPEVASLDATTSMTARNQSPQVAYLASTGGTPSAMASSVSRVYLGVRLECAQCHDHPFTDWTQQDFWGVAAFFSGARLNPIQQVVAGRNTNAPGVDSRSTQVADESGQQYNVSLPWDADTAKIEIPDDQFPREFFANWLTSTANPHFAATAVNRIWEHLCGGGLTASVDDLDQATEEERAILLDELAERFASGGFNVKQLVQAICASKFYQRSAARSEGKQDENARPLKVLTPEQLFDSLEVALAMPISSIDRGPRYNGERTALVSRMEEAIGSTPREFRSGIPQALTLMNGKITADATDLERSRTLRAVVDAPFLDIDEKIDTLFLATLSRDAHASEKSGLLKLINSRSSEQEKADAFSEIMWGLINSPEFVLVR